MSNYYLSLEKYIMIRHYKYVDLLVCKAFNF